MPAKISPYQVGALSEEERAQVKQQAAAEGVDVSSWFRKRAKLPPLENSKGQFKDPAKNPRKRKP